VLYTSSGYSWTVRHNDSGDVCTGDTAVARIQKLQYRSLTAVYRAGIQVKDVGFTYLEVLHGVPVMLQEDDSVS